MEVNSTERGFLEQNIEGELSDYKKYMEQAQQATNPQLARLWQMIAQDERRHAERQRAFLEMAGQTTAVPPAAAVPAPGPGFEWRGAPWPGPATGGVPRPGPVMMPRPAAQPMPWPTMHPRSGCCGGDPR